MPKPNPPFLISFYVRDVRGGVILECPTNNGHEYFVSQYELRPAQTGAETREVKGVSCPICRYPCYIAGDW